MTIFAGISVTQFVRPVISLLERLCTDDEITRKTLDDHSAKLRVSIPAKVLLSNPLNQTVTVQPLIREKILDRQTGKIIWADLPILQDVTVQYPGGSLGVLTHPLSPGDEVMLLFQDRCYDSWWSSGQVSNWNDRRFHDLSDAIAIPGLNSVPRVIPAVAPDAIELRNYPGNVRIGVGIDFIRIIVNEFVSTFSNGNWELNGQSINLNGNLIINGQEYNLHEHLGVQTGPGTTGPVAGTNG